MKQSKKGELSGLLTRIGDNKLVNIRLEAGRVEW